MVYADVAVASKKKPLMPTALDLDDTCVEYVRIDHKRQKEKIMKPQVLPDINKSDSRHGMTCMVNDYYDSLYSLVPVSQIRPLFVGS